MTEPGAADVTVFYSALQSVPASVVAALEKNLRHAELERANRFKFEKDRSLFVISRALLYHSMSHLTGIRNWRLRLGRHGKPEIISAEGEPSVHFNLSHTAGLVACAISHSYAVGIDLEATDRNFDFSSIAERFFSQSERQYLRACAVTGRSEAFFRIWTVKESVMKAIGDGLSIPLADITVGLDPVSIQFARDLRQDPAQWHVEELKPTPIHQAALAVRRPAEVPLGVRWQSVDVHML